MQIRKIILLVVFVLAVFGIGFVGVKWGYKVFKSSSEIVVINNDPDLKVIYDSRDLIWRDFISELGILKENGVLIELEDRGVVLVTVKKINVIIEPATQAISTVKRANGDTLESYDLRIENDELFLTVNVNHKLYNEKYRRELANERYKKIIAFRLAGLSAKYYLDGTYTLEQQWELLETLISYEDTNYLTVSVL